MRAALPAMDPLRQRPNSGGSRNPPKRRSNKNGRRQPQPSAGPAIQTNSALLRVRDTEFLGLVSTGFSTLEFNPGNTKTPRLAAFEKMYTRYRIISITLTYVPSTSTYSTDNISYGVASGPINTDIKGADTIMRLKPAHMRPAYTTSNIKLNRSIMSQPWLYCGDNSRDGVAFVLYLNASGNNLGHFTVTYDIEFTNPRPFS